MTLMGIQYQGRYVRFHSAILMYVARAPGYPDQMGMTQYEALSKVMDLIDLDVAEERKIARQAKLTAPTETVKIAA